MAEAIKVLSIVALTIDVPERNLTRGQVGTIVEELGRDVFEVEFADDHGRTYATAPLPASALMILHYNPIEAA